jgi:DNA repair photolyase
MVEENTTAFEWFKCNKQRELDKKQHYTSFKVSSEYMDCSTCFSMDFYSMCFYSCTYCFAYFQKSNNPSFNMEAKVKPINVKNTIDIFEGKQPENPYYKHFIQHKKIVHIGGMADNFCGFEKKFKEGIPLIEYLLKTGYPMIISTKADFLNYPEYAELFEKYKDVACCAIQSSIITYDKEVAAKVEIGVPEPELRFQNLKKLSAMGYYTILRLRPFIIGISDRTLTNILNKMVEYNIHAISTEFYCMDCRVDEKTKSNYRWMSNVCGFDIEDYYKQLSPTSRGTYRRLNRKVKEKYIKEMYMFCVKNNKHFACSDPDFKELNDSGSCCGLPTDKNKWGLLTNFLNSQLTEAIRELRERYWKSGRVDKYLTVKNVMKDPSYTWMKESAYYNDSISKVGLCNSKFQKMSHYFEFIQSWNNVRSPRNPYNYFDGKIKPSGKKDEEGNIIFEYVPMPYEEQWRKEGIL